MLYLLFFSYALLCAGILMFVRKRKAPKLAEQQRLCAIWRAAQKRRQEWRERRVGFFDFNSPEYQALWRDEIIKESIFFASLSRGYRFLKTSATLYARELEESERLKKE